MYGPSGDRVDAVAPGPTITDIEAVFASPLGANRVQAAMAVMTDPGLGRLLPVGAEDVRPEGPSAPQT